MSVKLPTGGFLVRSGVQRDCKEYFNTPNKRRGIYKALDAIVIRLSLLLTLRNDPASEQTLNNLFVHMCHDNDIIFCFKAEPGTTVYNLLKLFTDALKAESPIAYIRDRARFEDNDFVVFDV